MNQPGQVWQPWSREQVKALNRQQADERYHPYTCPGDKPDCADRRLLVATTHGWVCQCGEYSQDWAHELAPMQARTGFNLIDAYYDQLAADADAGSLLAGDILSLASIGARYPEYLNLALDLGKMLARWVQLQEAKKEG